MGYGFTAIAGHVFDSMLEALKYGENPELPSNTWRTGARTYFVEQSRNDYHDGGIRGTVYRFVGADCCQRSGSVAIDGNGKIIRWTGSNKSQRQFAEEWGRVEFALWQMRTGGEVVQVALKQGA